MSVSMGGWVCGRRLSNEMAVDLGVLNHVDAIRVIFKDQSQYYY